MKASSHGLKTSEKIDVYYKKQEIAEKDGG